MGRAHNPDTEAVLSDHDLLGEIDAALAGIAEFLPTSDGDGAMTVDEPAVRGDRGLLRLDRYRLSHDAADLAGAIDDLAAVTTVTEHADWPLWCYGLGVAHVMGLGDVPDAASTLTTAIAWMERAYGQPHPDVDRHGLGVEIAGAYWVRHADAGAPGAGVDELIATLTRLAVPEDHDAHDLWRAYLGTTHVDRFDDSEDSADLDRAVDLLDPAVDRLPDDSHALSAAYDALARAYAQRYDLDDDRTALDRVVAVTARGADRTPIDDPLREALLWRHQFALTRRFELVGDHVDRDRIIDTLGGLLERMAVDEVDPLDAWALADMLYDRGRDYRLADDLVAAARWFRVALPGLPADYEDRWLLAMHAAQAYRLHRSITGRTDHVRSNLDVLEDLLTLGPPDPDLTLWAHVERLGLIDTLLDGDIETAATTPRETAGPLREAAGRAHDALMTVTGKDVELRATLALMAAAALVQASSRDERTPDVATIQTLLGIARSHPAPDPAYVQLTAALSVPVSALEAMRDPRARGDFGLPDLARALLDRPGTEVSEQLRSLAAVTRYMRAQRLGDLRELGRVVDDRSTGPDLFAELEILRAIAQVGLLITGGDFEAAVRSAQRAVRELRASGDRGSSVSYLTSFMAAIIAMGELAAGRTPEPVALPPALSDDHMIIEFQPMVRIVVSAVNAMVFARRGEAPAAEAAVADLIEAVENTPPGQRIPHINAMAAMGSRLVLSERAGDRGLHERALAWGEAALTGMDAGDPGWAPASLQLAHLFRQRAVGDDAARARELGLSAMAGHAWRVLLQSDIDSGLLGATSAVSDALTVAGWCLDDASADGGEGRARTLEQLVRTLDAGRALVLQAATATGRVRRALLDRGETALADAWRDGGHLQARGDDTALGLLEALASPTLDLRRRVVQALTDRRGGPDSVAGMFDPPRVTEIAEALTGAERDAMVFLVGGPDAPRGYAVLVFASGAVDVIPLPTLTASEPVGSYVRTHQGSAHSAGAEFDAWRAQLDRVCDWAWGPMERILTACPAAHGDVPRLVLVPFGVLGIVPWHAAGTVDSGIRRPAMRYAVISVAASARLWCDAARQPSRSGPALVIGDPNDGRSPAAVEAVAVHRAFYPDGVYFGQPPDLARGAGTAAEILAWLGTPDGPPCPVLHAAGHGIVDVDHPASSHLRVAGGGLRADDLIERMTRGGRPLGTVVLAACTTSLTGAAYDEALSLSTAFLVAGARAVVGSLWSVPSASTGLLMFMFHRYLSETPDRPAGALRRAQLWMADPARTYPAEMPTALVDRAPLDRLTDPYRWAGFSHIGR